MLQRRQFIALAAGSLLLPQAAAQATPTPAEQFNELGPENEAIAQRAGLWDVTQTSLASPDAAPVVTIGLVAERQMIGSFLQEMLRASADPVSTILRIDYLTFNRLEGVWEYLSMDTRAPAAMMPATSFGRDEPDRIQVTFEPLVQVGAGPDVAGRLLRIDQVITIEGPDRDVKDQTFLTADGTGREWLGNQYAYVRRS